MKFIERQKLTRLEKSIKRQITDLKEQSTDSGRDAQIHKLQEQIKSVALDQLYIAFYPADLKYMSLFTNGMDRVVDDERGQKRRKEVWTRIRQNLLSDLNQDNCDGKLLDTKTWINLDAAKRALLEMDEDTYPNASIQNNAGTATNRKSKVSVGKRKPTDDVGPSNSTTDNRFVLSKEIDGMFQESTTGTDYENRLLEDDVRSEDDSDSSSDSSDDSSDDADPLKGVDKNKREENYCNSDNNVELAQSGKDDEEESSSSSSVDSDSSSESEVVTSNENISDNKLANLKDSESSSDEESKDDFFATEKVSAEEVFAQAEEKHYKHHDDESQHYSRKKDKSKGFSTQNQTKREFRNFQHRKKRSRLG